MVDIAQPRPALTEPGFAGLAGEPKVFVGSTTHGFDGHGLNDASDADDDSCPLQTSMMQDNALPPGCVSASMMQQDLAAVTAPQTPGSAVAPMMEQNMIITSADNEAPPLPSSKPPQGITARVDSDVATAESSALDLTMTSSDSAKAVNVQATPTAKTLAWSGRRSSVQSLDAYRDNQAVERQINSARLSYSSISSSSSMTCPAFKAEAFFLTHALEESMETARHASRSQRDRPSGALGALVEVGEARLSGGLAVLRLVHQCATQTPKFKRNKSAQASDINLRKIKRITVTSVAKRTAAEADERLLVERLGDFIQQGFTVEDLNRADDKTGETPLHLMAAKNLAQAIRAIVKLGAAIDSCDNEGITPLLTAAQHGADGAARALLELGARPELASLRGELPLHEALMRGHYLTAEAMLLTGLVNVDLCNAPDAVVDRGKVKPRMYRSSPLNAVLAAKTDADLLACCRVLCKYGPSLLLNSEAGNGLTPLELCIKRHLKFPAICGEVACAARNGSITVPSSLLEKKRLAGAPAPELTMLWTFFEAGCTQAAAALIELGADTTPPVCKKERRDMFLYAIQTGQIMLARPLLSHLKRSGLDLAKATGNTGGVFAILPFEAAKRNDPLEVRWWIGAFIDAGLGMHGLTVPPVSERADKNDLRAFDGETSLLLDLIKRGHVDAATALWDSYISQDLPVDIDEMDACDCSLLFYSVYRRANNDRTLLTQRLVKAGCDRTRANKDGVTPLLAACRANNMRGALAIINQSFAAGEVAALHWKHDSSYPPLTDPAQLNMKDKRGNTPLYYAVMHGNAQLAALLLHYGADSNLGCGTAYIMTPLHLAVRRDRFGTDELVSLLLAYGANPTIKTVSSKKHGGGLTAIDFSYMNEYSLSPRPMTETLARYAGGPMENFFCDAVLKLYRGDVAWCASHNPDDGFGEYKEGDQTRKGPLTALYAKAYKHCPPYLHKIVDISKATYENGKELLDKLFKAKLKVNGAKLGAMAVKIAIMASGVATGIEDAIISSVVETIIEIMIDALLDYIIGINTDLVGNCLDLAVKIADECVSMTHQSTFSTYYNDMNVACKCRFKTKEAMDKIAYFNPMTWSTKADVYKNGIREFMEKTPSKTDPLRLRDGERVVSLDGRTGTTLLDLGAKTYGPQYIIEMDDTSEHLPFSRESLVSVDVLEKKARGEIKLSLSLDDTKDCLKLAVAERRNVTKDKSKGNFVRITVDNALLKNAKGKPAKGKDLVCDIGKSLSLYGMDSSKTKSIGVARVELWCAGRGGSKKLVGGVAIPIRDLVKGDGPDAEWTPIYRNYDVPTEEQLREDDDEDEDAIKPPAEIPPWEGESRFGLFKSDEVDEAMLQHIEARMAADAPHFDSHHLRPFYPRLDWTTPQMEKTHLKLIDKHCAVHDKEAEKILSRYDKAHGQLQGKLASCQWFSAKAREKQIKKVQKALLKARAKERKVAKQPKLGDHELEEEHQATLAEAEAQYREQNRARCYLAASAMERLRLQALQQLLAHSLQTADNVRATLSRTGLKKDDTAGETLDKVHQLTERRVWRFYMDQVHSPQVFSKPGLLEGCYKQEVELNRRLVLTKAHPKTLKLPKLFDVEAIHRRPSNLSEQELQAFLAAEKKDVLLEAM